MTARQVAEELLNTPDAHVLIKVGNDWCETVAVVGTGRHRNAVTLETTKTILGENHKLLAVSMAADGDPREPGQQTPAVFAREMASWTSSAWQS